MNIQYEIESDLSAKEFVEVLQRSTLAQRRPVDQIETIEAMLRGATVIVTARVAAESANGVSSRKLVGVSRAITDGAYCTYLSDLAVDVEFQRKGIGRELINRTHSAAGLSTTLILLSAPQAQTYYPRIGMAKHDSCWTKVVPEEPACKPASNTTPQTIPTGVSANGSQHLPPESAVGKFFDTMAGDYNDAIDRCFPRYREMLSLMLRYLEGDRPRRVLELGCGTGNLSLLLGRQFPDSSFTFVDLSVESLEQCQARLRDSDGVSKQLTFVHADMRKLQCADKEFDLIVSSIALHHLRTDEKQTLLTQLFQWLQPGGKLLFADQFRAQSPSNYQAHIDTWRTISKEAGASEQEWDDWMQHQREHDHHDTLETHFAALSDAGFQRVDVLWRYLLWSIVQAERP